MKYTQLPGDAFTHLQMNAGIITKSFTPATGAVNTSDIMGATTGGFSFNSNPTYTDFGEDVDNCPPNTYQLKKITSYDPNISGTFLTVSSESVKRLAGAADIDSDDTTHIVPRTSLTAADFADVWIIGDYSNANTGANAGYLAIHLKHALNTAGFQWTTTKDGKGQFAFDFHGHYDLTNIDDVPFEIFIKEGTSENVMATLSALSITGVTLSPTFSSGTTAYEASTTDSTNVVTATATDSTNATVVILVNGNSITNGSEATWRDGENTVTVIVSNGGATKTYTVLVTKGT